MGGGEREKGSGGSPSVPMTRGNPSTTSHAAPMTRAPGVPGSMGPASLSPSFNQPQPPAPPPHRASQQQQQQQQAAPPSSNHRGASVSSAQARGNTHHPQHAQKPDGTPGGSGQLPGSFSPSFQKLSSGPERPDSVGGGGGAGGHASPRQHHYHPSSPQPVPPPKPPHHLQPPAHHPGLGGPGQPVGRVPGGQLAEIKRQQAMASLTPEQLKQQAAAGIRLKQLLGAMGMSGVAEGLAGPDALRLFNASLASASNTQGKGAEGAAGKTSASGLPSTPAAPRPKPRVSERLAVVSAGRLRGAFLGPLLLPQDDTPALPPPALAAATVATMESGQALHAHILQACRARLEAAQQHDWARPSKVGWFLVDAAQADLL
ncbi:hypothetical protein V8C86DRAFT_1492017 [Haematococcus lacustris]